MKLSDYLTVAEAAAQTGLKYKTLLKRIDKGTVKAERLGGRTFLVSKKEVARVKALVARKS